MKTVGLLGGMSWESTVGYYRAINEGVKNTLGGLHSAKIALYSVDFEPIDVLEYGDNYYDLKFSLENILKRNVDLLEEKAIKNPYFRKTLNQNKVLIYG